MKLSSIRQLPFRTIAEGYNLVIAASGYESRARFVAEGAAEYNTPAGARLVFAFVEHSDKCARPDNDACFQRLGYESVLCRGSSGGDIMIAVQSAFAQLGTQSDARILVDISSMTRVWYGAVVRALVALARRRAIVVHFTYTPAEFIEPPDDYPPNRVVAPVAGFTGNTLPDKPTALVLGLGYDKDRAIGLKDHLDPQLTVAFYADPSSDDRYVERVQDVNARLLSEIADEHIFTYPIDDCVASFKSLESVCKGLTHEWRVVLCSLGPKLFGLYSFLTASISRDVSIWRVSADSHELPFDHKPFGSPTLFETVWAEDERSKQGQL